jgi:hypothetical protein
MTSPAFPRQSARARTSGGELYVLFRPPGSKCCDPRRISRDMDLELSERHNIFLSHWALGDFSLNQKEIWIPLPSRDARRVEDLPPAEAVEIEKGNGTFYIGAERFCDILKNQSRNLLIVEVASPVPEEELARFVGVEHLRKLEGKIPPEIHARLLARKLAET